MNDDPNNNQTPSERFDKERFDKDNSHQEDYLHQEADGFGKDPADDAGEDSQVRNDASDASHLSERNGSETDEDGDTDESEPHLVSARKKQTDSDEPSARPDDPVTIDPFARRRTRGNRAKPKRTPMTIFFDVVIAVIALVGLYLVLSPIISNWQQDRMTSQLEDAYLEGDGFIEIDPDAWAVEGEELEYAQLENDSSPVTETTQTTEAAETEAAPEETQPTQADENNNNQDAVRVKAIGRIEIDVIDLSMPVASRSTVHDLRVAIGHYSPSAAFGEPGLTVLLGHRMYTRGRHFNRLDEVKAGHEVVLSNKTHRFVYVVDEIRIVEPQEMLAQLRQLQLDEPRLMLVTCDPVRIASHRLLVYGHLASVEPLS